MPSRKTKGRRARGTGTIFWREGKARWVARVQVGRKPSGKPKYVECWGKTQGEVIKKMAAAKPPGPEVTVAGWVTHWWATLTVRPETRKNYRKHLKHILAHLGALRLDAVDAVTIERMAAELREKLKPTTVAVAVSVTRLVFAAAVRAGRLPANPVSVARKPKVPKVKVETFTPAELLKVIGAAGRYSGSAPVALLAACGCRIGEAVGLDVPDFDPAAGTIAITKTVHGDGSTGPPKSENGVRTIQVPDAALPALRAAAGRRKAGPLFTTSTGRRLPQRYVTVVQTRTLADLGLPHRRGHVLRHSVASHLVAAGVPVADVAKYLGDSVMTIVKTYVHATGTNPAAALNRLYGGRKVGDAGKAPAAGRRKA
ncbi:MAG TPA: site-specific integrase [Urbifossiella sp.]|nr:site-specific integrase [Urbifossiella sp.]